MATDDHRWVVRPKAPAPVTTHQQARREPAKRIPKPAFVEGGPIEPAPAPEADGSPRRWLALGLAGMVYVAGAAGLWSMVQTFEEAPSVPLRPAGDTRALPPIDEEIDVRDARLDGPFVPKFRPDTPFSPDADIAASDLQTRG